jgi:hypothetical protein
MMCPLKTIGLDKNSFLFWGSVAPRTGIDLLVTVVVVRPWALAL